MEKKRGEKEGKKREREKKGKKKKRKKEEEKERGRGERENKNQGGVSSDSVYFKSLYFPWALSVSRVFWGRGLLC